MEKDERKERTVTKPKSHTAEEVLNIFFTAWKEEDWTGMSKISQSATKDTIETLYGRFKAISYSIFNTEYEATEQTISMRVNLVIKENKHEINGRQMSIRLMKKTETWLVLPESLFQS